MEIVTGSVAGPEVSTPTNIRAKSYVVLPQVVVSQQRMMQLHKNQ